MKIIQKLCGVLFLAVSIGFAGQGCALQDDRESTPAGADVDEAAEPLVCPTKEPGLPIPVQYDDAYVSCMISCKAAGHPSAACKRGCCTTYTGCSMCYQQ
ncbi:Hypothetical protein A7982_01338 [Minicystis rosea]|nr:Hypothetical protein A7982_01338 [Minicystis rosea]